MYESQIVSEIAACLASMSDIRRYTARIIRPSLEDRTTEPDRLRQLATLYVAKFMRQTGLLA
jgi:DNA-binding transcriptional regulator YbjK